MDSRGDPDDIRAAIVSRLWRLAKLTAKDWEGCLPMGEIQIEIYKALVSLGLLKDGKAVYEVPEEEVCPNA